MNTSIRFFSPLFLVVLSLAPLFAEDGSWIQAALDKNPGRTITVPPGDYEISQPVTITADNSGLCGFGRIIQTNPAVDILDVKKANGVRISDITLTRPAGKTETPAVGFFAQKCKNLVVSNIRVLNNRSDNCAVDLMGCVNSQLRDSLVLNYMKIGIDDRTANPDQGYAFRVINGCGITIDACKSTLVQGNQVIENELLPTPEIKEKYGMGKFVKKNAAKGALLSQAMWDSEYYNCWHQGSGILLGGPTVCDYIQVIGNYVQNAAQGLDIHADHVIAADNIVNDSFMGMKSMHGARNEILASNQFSKSALWSIGFMPGSGTHDLGDPQMPGPANIEGRSVIAYNIVSDFGYGHSAWMWKDSAHYAIRLDAGPRPKHPRLTSVVLEGNIVYDPGKDGVLVDGKPQVVPPGYKYAIYMDTSDEGPQDMHFGGNLLNPGTDGASNTELKP